MEAIKFLEEAKRMCGSHDVCEACPMFTNESYCAVDIELKISSQEIKRMVKAVEQWSKEHPKNTRRLKLLSVFPNLHFDVDGLPVGCVCHYDKTFRCPVRQGVLLGNRPTPCVICKQQFWNEEIAD